MNHRFALLLCLYASPAFSAEDCAPVDLRGCFGAPRDQGETGWCFATTTADLASCAIGRRVSATDIAITYHLAPADLPGFRRDVDEALTGPEERARFDEWVSRDYPVGDSFKIGRNGSLPDFKGLYSMGGEEDIAFLSAAARGFCLDARLPSGPAHDEKNIREAARFAASKKAREGTKLAHIPPGHRKVAEAFWGWADQRCGKRLRPEQLFLPRSFQIAEDSVALLELGKDPASLSAKRAELIAVIDEHLSHGRPVAAGIDTRDMTTEEWSGEDPEHSIIFAGRKRIGGECHYFVRNTGGASCKIYLPKLRPAENCDAKAGGIWTPLSALPSLYSAIAIEKVEGRRRPASGGRPALPTCSRSGALPSSCPSR